MLRALPSLVRTLRRLRQDRAGASAVEFAVILPMMLVLFFGTVELSNGVAVDRKVTLVARTLSDLTSQANPQNGGTGNYIYPQDLTNVFAASNSIMTPYDPAGTLTKAIISEIYVDASGNATIAWSRANNTTANTCGTPVNLPTGLAVPNTYLIYGQATYTYTPVVGYVMKTALTLQDQFFTRPRQSTCMLLCTTNNVLSSCQTNCPTTTTTCP
ncbi:MAG: pilus assembly protein [Xanthobacteraceae bacterium]|nr:pilus assembly protein [Xanthobacteraceae bacterium]